MSGWEAAAIFVGVLLMAIVIWLWLAREGLKRVEREDEGTKQEAERDADWGGERD